MPRFRRLYIDSSVLIASNWPRISADLERTIQWCDLLKVKVVLPKAVEDELEIHWIETFRDKCRKAYNANEELAIYLSQAVNHDSKLTLPNEQIALEGFRKCTQEVKDRWKIDAIPLTSRSLDEIFRFAVEHHAPFTKGDKGFKDAVIYFSVIDDLAKTPSVAGAFISFDKIFGELKVGDLAKSTKVSLVTYTSIDDLDRELMTWVEGALKDLWEKDRDRAQSSIKKRLGDIEKFLLENFEIGENDVGLGMRLVGVEGLKVLDVRNVQTPPLAGRSKKDVVKMSFEAQVELRTIVEQTFVMPPPSKFKVGERGPKFDALNLNLGMLLGGPVQEERKLPWIVEIEATSTPEDKEYKDITFVSVRSKRSLRDRMLGLDLATLLSNETVSDTK